MRGGCSAVSDVASETSQQDVIGEDGYCSMKVVDT